MNRDDFREKLIASAKEIFEHFGYKKTTMDDIAQSLGKGKSSIYYYFSSKEEIFQAVVENEAGLLRTEVMKAIDKTNDPIEQIKNYVLTRMRINKKTRNYFNVLTNDDLLHLDFIEKIREDFEKEEIKMMEDILKKGVESNKFQIETPGFASIAIITAIKGLEALLIEQYNDESTEDRLDKLLRVLFYGIVKR